jgi:cobalt-zinc-cadmium efflux system outer membrane protein
MARIEGLVRVGLGMATWAVISTLLIATSGSADDGKPLALETVIADARARNPAMQAAAARARAAAAMPAQATAWDDPTASWEAWNAPDSFRVDRADNNIFKLAQRIPFPGKRRLAGDVAMLDAERAKQDVAGTELTVLTAVTSAYYALWEAHARVTVLERDRDLVARLTRVVENKYGAGDASQSDALRLQVELTHMANQLETAHLQVDRARAELAALVSRPSTDLRGLPVAPTPPRLAASLEQLLADAFEHRPDLLAAHDAVARDGSAVELAERNRLPDFEVSVARFVNHDAPDGFGAMASVTLPILNRGRYEAAIAEANARLAATRADERHVEDRVRREVEQAYLSARTALLQHQLFAATHIPQAEQALRVTEGAYETGGAQFTELIDTLRGVQSVHLEHLAAAASFENAYAELERAVGRELPRDAPAAPAAQGHHD